VHLTYIAYWHVVHTAYYTVAKKVSPLTCDNTFGKCGPIQQMIHKKIL